MSQEDAVKVAPKVYKVVFENDRIRVLEAKLKKGQKSAMHYHPPNFVYVLEPGNVQFTTPEGKTQKVRMKAGGTFWFEASSHAAQNTGTKTATALIVELKT